MDAKWRSASVQSRPLSYSWGTEVMTAAPADKSAGVHGIDPDNNKEVPASWNSEGRTPLVPQSRSVIKFTKTQGFDSSANSPQASRHRGSTRAKPARSFHVRACQKLDSDFLGQSSPTRRLELPGGVRAGKLGRLEKSQWTGWTDRMNPDPSPGCQRTMQALHSAPPGRAHR